jgi:hypothetical protein
VTPEKPSVAHVRPIPGETTSFHVRSKSHPQAEHLVDLKAHVGGMVGSKVVRVLIPNPHYKPKRKPAKSKRGKAKKGL